MAVLRSLAPPRRARRSFALALLALLVAAAASGCCTASRGEGLEGIDWRLVGSSASSTDFRVYGITARFEEGTLNGRSAVNSYTARYELTGGASLSMSDLTSTLIAGTPDAMRAEETYFTMLRAVRSWRVANGQLELRDGDGNPLLIYVEADRTAPPEAPVGEQETSSPEPTSTASASKLSDTSLAYARSIGGTPHRGELLYLVIGDTYPSEAAATAALNEALPVFGDMQTFFIVQRSDGFAGLVPGQWLVFEAYRLEPKPENLQLARRAFPEAAVRRATVRTDDPIPVYEDLVGR